MPLTRATQSRGAGITVTFIGGDINGSGASTMALLVGTFVGVSLSQAVKSVTIPARHKLLIRKTNLESLVYEDSPYFYEVEHKTLEVSFREGARMTVEGCNFVRPRNGMRPDRCIFFRSITRCLSLKG